MAKTRRQTTCYRIRTALNCDVANHFAGIETIDAVRRLANKQTFRQVVFKTAPTMRQKIKSQPGWISVISLIPNSLIQIIAPSASIS